MPTYAFEHDHYWLNARGVVARGPWAELPAITADAGAALRDKLAGLSAKERSAELVLVISEQVAAVLGHLSPDMVDVDRALSDLGFDSLAAIELRRRLGVLTGLRLPATLVFDHPTCAAIAAHIDAELAPANTEEPVLRQLDALGATLAGLAPVEGQHAAVEARLAALLRRWQDGGAAEPPTDDDFSSATDEELFAAVDSELGPAPSAGQ